MRPLILCLAGAIGTGKTAVSVEVSNFLGWRRAGFGDYVRALADERALDKSRETLQKLGEAEILAKGCTAFCKNMLTWCNWEPGHGIIIDGVRHVDVLLALRALASPMPTHLIFLQTDESTRHSRLARRGDLDELQPHIAAHSTEAQIETSLADYSAFTVDVSRSLTEVVSLIEMWMRTLPQ